MVLQTNVVLGSLGLIAVLTATDLVSSLAYVQFWQGNHVVLFFANQLVDFVNEVGYYTLVRLLLAQLTPVAACVLLEEHLDAFPMGLNRVNVLAEPAGVVSDQLFLFSLDKALAKAEHLGKLLLKIIADQLLHGFYGGPYVTQGLLVFVFGLEFAAGKDGKLDFGIDLGVQLVFDFQRVSEVEGVLDVGHELEVVVFVFLLEGFELLQEVVDFISVW